MDGDGLPDLVSSAGNDIAPGPLRVYAGLPEGPPAASPTWASADLALRGHLAVGDVDGDDWVDVAVTRYEALDGGVGGVDVYAGGPDGLGPTPRWSWTGAHAFGVALGDVDDDGDLDLALATGHLEPPVASPDLLFVNEGGFGDAPAWETPPSVSLDVAFLGQELVFARARSPHARYAPPAQEPAWEAPGAGFGGNRLALGDLDGDGLVDLAVSENLHVPAQGQVRLYCGADWALCWESAEPPAAWSALGLIDVDRDGDLDVVAGQWWGPLVAWETRQGRPEAVAWRSEREHVAEALVAAPWGPPGGFVVSDWEPTAGLAAYAR